VLPSRQVESPAGGNDRYIQKAATVVSIIEMQDSASLVLERAALNHDLLIWLKRRASKRAASHGNYLPALDAVLRLLRQDAVQQVHLFIVMLSDGAPSDHIMMECPHGVQVWQPDIGAGFTRWGRPRLQQCGSSSLVCRRSLIDAVQMQCLTRVKKLGDLFGRDRLMFSTVAFGPLDDDYSVLQGMASVLPLGNFQKLGLSASGLSSAFSSLTSSLTSMRTLAGSPLAGLTLRAIQKMASVDRALLLLGDEVRARDGWVIYLGAKVMAKRSWSYERRDWEELRLDAGSKDGGVAIALKWYADGAERLVYGCTEVVQQQQPTTWLDSLTESLRKVTFGGEVSRKNGSPSVRSGDRSQGDGWSGRQAMAVAAPCTRVGRRLVAKETKHEELLADSLRFHQKFCQTQAHAEHLAREFCELVQGPAGFALTFVKCVVYRVWDERYPPDGTTWVLVEPELEGKFVKWNNNAGGVHFPDTHAHIPHGSRAQHQQNLPPVTVGSFMPVLEEDEEEEEENWDEDGGEVGSIVRPITAEDVPQCFSHFTHSVTGGRKVVCDLQGVWNPEDGFTLTDPVIHAISASGRRHKHGVTDKGREGIDNFFKTHVCNPLCVHLKLRMPR
jgi:hypothetical protein